MRPLLWMALLALTLAPALTACNGASSAGQDLAGVQGLRPVLQHY